MLSQGFGTMSLGPAAAQQPVSPMMMHPGGGMGMVPNQAMMGMNMGGPQLGMGMAMGMPANMGMGMNMGGPQLGMGMGMPGAMGMSMGMNSSMVQQQPKQDAFADFGNFGK